MGIPQKSNEISMDLVQQLYIKLLRCKRLDINIRILFVTNTSNDTLYVKRIKGYNPIKSEWEAHGSDQQRASHRVREYSSGLI